MFRDCMTGNPALAMFEALLMIFATWSPAARPKPGRGRSKDWPCPSLGAPHCDWFSEVDVASAASDRRRGSLREVRLPPRYTLHSSAPG
jgi:hypothetical protein